jgi:hypothetical protein
VDASEGKWRLGGTLTRRGSEHYRDVALVVRRRCTTSTTRNNRTSRGAGAAPAQ